MALASAGLSIMSAMMSFRGCIFDDEKSWDKVPIDAQTIAPLSRAAAFLVVTVAPGQSVLANVCSTLDGLDDLLKTVGFVIFLPCRSLRW